MGTVREEGLAEGKGQGRGWVQGQRKLVGAVFEVVVVEEGRFIRMGRNGIVHIYLNLNFKNQENVNY